MPFSLHLKDSDLFLHRTSFNRTNCTNQHEQRLTKILIDPFGSWTNRYFSVWNCTETFTHFCNSPYWQLNIASTRQESCSLRNQPLKQMWLNSFQTGAECNREACFFFPAWSDTLPDISTLAPDKSVFTYVQKEQQAWKRLCTTVQIINRKNC